MKEKCVYFKIDQIPKQNLKYKIMDVLNIFEKKEDEQKIVYTLYKSNKNYIKKINSKINKINESIVLAKEIKENAKKEEYKNTNIYSIVKTLEEDKKLLSDFAEEILKNIIEKQKQVVEQQSIYILAKENNIQRKNQITNLLAKYKAVNIITANIREFKKLEENLEESSETFAVLNNKKKSLTRAQYIINVDFNEKEILEYNINRTATIINLNKGKLNRRAAKAASSLSGQWMARTASALESRRYFWRISGGSGSGRSSAWGSSWRTHRAMTLLESPSVWG